MVKGLKTTYSNSVDQHQLAKDDVEMRNIKVSGDEENKVEGQERRGINLNQDNQDFPLRPKSKKIETLD